ncbi:uncharacterized protein CCR75_003548 [Bremia lactucae]|uniref:Uncharacterized protein n=1 Tax=Bremia lactucae TaxID=4779 RepID=A0A976FRU6_BRELC|nr:hypothetical protein CCR75_003548 [Bremia lactucae]
MVIKVLTILEFTATPYALHEHDISPVSYVLVDSLHSCCENKALSEDFKSGLETHLPCRSSEKPKTGNQ